MSRLKRIRARNHSSKARRVLAVGMIGALVLVSVFAASVTRRNLAFEAISSARAQEHEHSNSASGQDLESLLDGSVNPELIPDDVAIKVLLATLRVTPNPDTVALAQLDSRIRRANLGDSDFEILVRELGRLDTNAKSQEARIEALRPKAAASRASIDRYIEEREVLNALFVEHYQQLLASLSPSGAANLRAHLAHVKSRIKVYPSPDMSASK